MFEEQCKICKFWFPVAAVLNEPQNTLQSGFCRRYPPSFQQAMDEEVKSSWEKINQDRYIYYLERLPLTAYDFWCGEFVIAQYASL